MKSLLLTSAVPKSRKMATNAVTPAPDADLAVVATMRQYPDLSEKVPAFTGSYVYGAAVRDIKVNDGANSST